MENDPNFEPLQVPHRTVKNRVLRSNLSGRFDYYNGTESPMMSAFENGA